jgi:hypothetical protein
MLILAGQRLEYVLSPSGLLAKLSGEFSGFPLPESGYVDVKTQQPVTMQGGFAETLKFDREINVDDTIVVASHTGEIFFKYNGFIN